MIQALLWKEWREQRGIAYAGLAVALMLPAIVTWSVWSQATSQGEISEIADIVPFLFGVIVWPLFASLAGATANIESGSVASATYLMSRPVPRLQVWIAKVAIAMVSVTFVVSVSYYAALQVDLLLGGYGFDFPFSSDPFSMSTQVVKALAVGGLFLIFSWSVLLSMFLRRPIGAAVGGVVMAVIVMVIGLAASGRIASIGSDGSGTFLRLYAYGVSAAVLGASMLAFRGKPIVGASSAWRALMRAVAPVALTVPVIVVLAGFTATRTVPANSSVSFESAVPGADSVLVELRRNSFAGSSLWLADTGKPLERLTPRMSSLIGVSPDGKWLVYRSSQSALGTRSYDCEIYLYDLESRGEHRRLLQLDQGSCTYRVEFSPDGSRLSFLSSHPSEPDTPWRALYVVPLDGGDPVIADLAPIYENQERYYSSNYWWVSDSRIVVAPRSGSAGYSFLDPASGELTPGPTPAADRVRSAVVSDGPMLLVTERARDEGDTYGGRAPEHRLYDDLLINLETEEVRPIATLCPGDDVARVRAAFSPSRTQLAYVCQRAFPSDQLWEYVDMEGLYSSELRRRDLTTGEDVLLRRLDSRIESFAPSPRGEHFLLRLANLGRVIEGRTLRHSFNRYRYAIVDSEGGDVVPNISHDAWRFNTWASDARAVFTGRSGRWTFAGRIGVLDVERGSQLQDFNLTSEGLR